MKVERKFDQRKENDCWLEKRNWHIQVLKGESESMKQIVGVNENYKIRGQLLTPKNKMKVWSREANFDDKKKFTCYVLDEFEFLQRSARHHAQKERRIRKV